jgi:nitrate reductase cytochrome c-type subunit
MGTNVILSDKQIEAAAKANRLITIIFGLMFSFAGILLLSRDSSYHVFGIASIVLGLFFVLVSKKAAAKNRQGNLKRREQALSIQKVEQTRLKAEQKRMADLQKTMTPGEWQTYQLQLENNRLLDEIARKSKQNQGAPGIRPVFGVTRDVPETDD